MKNKKTHVCAMLSGMLLAVLLTQVVLPAGAAMTGKTIQVFTGVTIYVDDVKLDPKDGNGNPVDAFIYNGTTYLPVAAVSQAVGKTVQWEGKSNSVYLGRHTGQMPAVWLKDLDYFSGSDFRVYAEDINNLGDTCYDSVGMRNGNGVNNVYLLNGQYSKITGSLYMRYELRSVSTETTLRIYGDGNLLYTATVSGGVKPVDFSVDLTGVLELTVKLSSPGNGTSAGIASCGLWT